MSDDKGFLPTGLRFSAIHQKKDGEILFERIIKLEEHLNKIYEMINMEDRITAGDVLNRLTLLEEKISLHEINLNRKWQANTELSNRLSEIESHLKEVCRFQDITNAQYKVNIHKKPHKCPVCDGNKKRIYLNTDVNGDNFKSQVQENKCHVCEGKGIVWG